jgi:dinuclear metal center protein, YbgI/SA1388 family
MPVKCKDIISIVDALAPKYLTLKSDNTGLILGDEKADIESILVSLDIDERVCDEAIQKKCSLIVTHHPVIYHPINHINYNDFKGKIISKLIQNNISVYSAHTNLDTVNGGINDYLVEKLNLTGSSLLSVTYEEELYKLAVYVPFEYADRVRDALTNEGAGHIGKYSHCTYNIRGEGTFKPLDGSSPFLGSVGSIEKVNEVKIETIVRHKDLQPIIDRMLEAHPYEEVAYDVYRLVNNKEEYGIGRIGTLKQPVTLEELCSSVKMVLCIDSLDVVGNLDRVVQKVGLCSGSGSEFIPEAFRAGCDVYITGDVRYHDACDARDMGLALINAGHFATENVYMAHLAEIIRSEAMKRSHTVNVYLSKENRNPFIKV